MSSGFHRSGGHGLHDRRIGFEPNSIFRRHAPDESLKFRRKRRATAAGSARRSPRPVESPATRCQLRTGLRLYNQQRVTPTAQPTILPESRSADSRCSDEVADDGAAAPRIASALGLKNCCSGQHQKSEHLPAPTVIDRSTLDPQGHVLRPTVSCRQNKETALSPSVTFRSDYVAQGTKRAERSGRSFGKTQFSSAKEI